MAGQPALGFSNQGDRTVLEDSFDTIFRERYRSVYRFLARRLGPDHAEQLAAEVFATAFRRRHDYVAQHDTPLPWLYGIANGLLANHRRREIRYLQACARLDRPALEIDPADASVARMDAVREWPVVAGLLAALTDEERDTLLLFVWSGLSYSQIAETLGIPTGTVRSRINKARSKLAAGAEARLRAVDHTHADGGKER